MSVNALRYVRRRQTRCPSQHSHSPWFNQWSRSVWRTNCSPRRNKPEDESDDERSDQTNGSHWENVTSALYYDTINDMYLLLLILCIFLCHPIDFINCGMTQQTEEVFMWSNSYLRVCLCVGCSSIPAAFSLLAFFFFTVPLKLWNQVGNYQAWLSNRKPKLEGKCLTFHTSGREQHSHSDTCVSNVLSFFCVCAATSNGSEANLLHSQKSRIEKEMFPCVLHSVAIRDAVCSSSLRLSYRSCGQCKYLIFSTSCSTAWHDRSYRNKFRNCINAI